MDTRYPDSPPRSVTIWVKLWGRVEALGRDSIVMSNGIGDGCVEGSMGEVVVGVVVETLRAEVVDICQGDGHGSRARPRGRRLCPPLATMTRIPSPREFRTLLP